MLSAIRPSAIAWNVRPLPDDIIQAGAEPATRDDPALQGGGIEVDALPRPRPLEGRRIDARSYLRAQFIDIGAEQDPVRGIHEDSAERRGDVAFAQIIGLEIWLHWCHLACAASLSVARWFTRQGTLRATSRERLEIRG
jgi:hypothetical protein